MIYTDFNRNSRNGAMRFIDFWRKISEKKISIKIIDNSDNNNLYTLEYQETDGKQYISLVDKGITLYFPLLTIPEGKEDKIVFDDEIVESNLTDLFKLLNNKKNFTIV